jgi:hypothetical protein
MTKTEQVLQEARQTVLATCRCRLARANRAQLIERVPRKHGRSMKTIHRKLSDGELAELCQIFVNAYRKW